MRIGENNHWKVLKIAHFKDILMGVVLSVVFLPFKSGAWFDPYSCRMLMVLRLLLKKKYSIFW